MAYRRIPFQIDEWFHCYNRGIDKRVVYESEDDAERFLRLLYLANSTNPLRLDELSKSTDKIMAYPRSRALVSVGAYCLMSNHYHLLLKEIHEGGISQFMQKLGTAYAMYFNIKYERAGNLFVKPFRSRHVGEDRYFQHVVNYIHLNPAETFESGWKVGAVKSMKRIERKIREYRYSSLPDYAGERRTITAILSSDGFDVYRNISTKKMLENARAYYTDFSKDDPESFINPGTSRL